VRRSPHPRSAGVSPALKNAGGTPALRFRVPRSLVPTFLVPTFLVSTLRVGTHGCDAPRRPADAERRNRWVPTRSVGTREWPRTIRVRVAGNGRMPLVWPATCTLRENEHFLLLPMGTPSCYDSAFSEQMNPFSPGCRIRVGLVREENDREPHGLAGNDAIS
jgi:hypothetical protein